MAKENVLSLKDFDPNTMHVVNKARKRQHTMEKNLKASQLIIAAKALKKEREDADLSAANIKLKEMKADDKLPIEAYTKTFDSRINVLSKKIKSLSELKEAQNGFLKEGQGKALKDFSLEGDRLKIEREMFVRKFEEKEKVAEVHAKKAAKEKEIADKIRLEQEAKDDATMTNIVDTTSPGKEQLIKKAKSLGIEAKGTWGEKKLLIAIKEKAGK